MSFTLEVGVCTTGVTCCNAVSTGGFAGGLFDYFVYYMACFGLRERMCTLLLDVTLLLCFRARIYRLLFINSILSCIVMLNVSGVRKVVYFHTADYIRPPGVLVVSGSVSGIRDRTAVHDTVIIEYCPMGVKWSRRRYYL